MGSRLSGLGSALWNSKRKQFLGRDGAGWAKLGTFYFFFYIGLAGFFCAMLAVFMALSPRDRPRYILHESRMETRSNPLAPGLGFRPQPEVDKNLIYVDRTVNREERSQYATHLQKYLEVYYWKQNKTVASAARNDEDNDSNEQDNGEPTIDTKPFTIANPGDCTPANNFGYADGKPCVLVKMNKLVDFEPKPGPQAVDKAAYQAACQSKQNAIAIHCSGENFADADSIGNVTYKSQNENSDKCGTLESDNFPYRGKVNRKDVYQAPYVWVQFQNPKPNILINVLCRVYAQNVELDKKTGRGITRFQLYVNNPEKRRGRGKQNKEF